MTSYLDKVEIYLDKVEIYLDKVKIKPWIVTYSCSILTRLRCAPSPIVTQRTPRIQMQHQFQQDFLGVIALMEMIGSVAKWQCCSLREATSAALPYTRRAGFWAVHESTRPVQPRSTQQQQREETGL